MNIAFIAGNYKITSEQWIWRQVDYLKEHISYIGVTGKVIDNDKTSLPIINIFDLPIPKLISSDPDSLANAKFFFLLRKLNKLEKKYGIDVYYIHYLTNAYLLSEYLAVCKKKIFVHCHGYDITTNLNLHSNPNKNLHSKNYLTFIKNIPKNICFIANSENTKSKLLDLDISARRIFVSKFGVPVEGFSEQKKNPLKILYLGRLVDFKGPDLTIMAFEKACDRGLEAELIIAGDGDMMVTCQLLKSRSAYNERIKLLGAINYEIGKKLRAECDIFTAHNTTGILSNQEEAYGVSVLEAMGAGLPVITGKSGGIKETVIHNKTGFLFNPGSIDEHADYLLLLYKDASLRKKIGIAAYNHVNKHFLLEKEKKNLLKIIQK